MAKQVKKSTRGGKREGAGRKPKADKDKVNSYNVYLIEKDKNEIIKDHGSLTKAILTTKPKPKKK